MFKNKESWNHILKSNLNNQKGITLVELLIVCALLGIVLSIGYSLNFFGVSSFSKGASQTNIQENVRLAADFITKEARNAIDLIILTPDEVPKADAIENDVYYILYNKNNTIEYRFKDHSKIIANVIDKLSFNKDQKSDKTLDFEIEGNDGKQNYVIHSQALITNLLLTEFPINGDMGNAIRYKKLSLGNSMEVIKKPTANPQGGNYQEKQYVTLSTETSGAKIYYTVDGTEPTITRDLYDKRIPIETSTTINAKAFNEGMIPSETATFAYTIGTSEPPITIPENPSSEGAELGHEINPMWYDYKSGQVNYGEYGNKNMKVKICPFKGKSLKATSKFTLFKANELYFESDVAVEGNGFLTLDGNIIVFRGDVNIKGNGKLKLKNSSGNVIEGKGNGGLVYFLRPQNSIGIAPGIYFFPSSGIDLSNTSDIQSKLKLIQSLS